MFQAMFREATVGILVANKQGVIIEANPYSEKLFGYDLGELNGKIVETLVPRSIRKKHVNHRENYHKSPSPRGMGAGLELFGLRKDGSQFPIEISLNYLKMEGELYALAYVSDDTIQVNMLQDIRESKERLEEAQRLAHVGSFQINIKEGGTVWSDEMYRIFGIEKNDEGITYEKYLSYIHPDDLEKVKNYHQEIREERKGIDFGYRIITKAKGLRYVQGKRDVKTDEDGNLILIYGLLQDVTDLKEAQNINKEISKIVEESLNEIYIFGADDLKFIQVNKGARQNIGYTLEEMQEITPVDIKPYIDEEEFRSLLVPLKNGQKDKLFFETVHQRKDGTTYPVEVHLQFSSIGLQSVYVAFIVDISERKKYDAQIKEYSESLENKVLERTKELKASEAKLLVSLAKEKELGELKSRFVSMASHEFRTPLTSILSSIELIGMYQKEDQQDKRMKHVDRITSAVKNLTTILNDFLSLEKLESGKVRYNPVDLDFKEYIQQIIDEVNLTKKGGQKITHQHTGNDIVTTDEHLLKNILLNLLSNAIKYSPEGKNVELNTQNKEDCLSIQVIDHGIGIPEEDQQHMFTRFFRANNAINIQGTGLGLTIVKRYLNLMKGTIAFESKEGEGTTFFLEILK